MEGYNDDLDMSYAIALWVRDTALRLQKDKNNQQRGMMDSMLKNNGNKVDYSEGFTNGNNQPKHNPWKWVKIGDEEEDLTWLIK